MIKVTSSQRANIEEALKSNIKLKTVEVGGVFRFCFRPPLEGVKDKKSFLRFLEAHYMAGLGGITKEHVLESVPRAEKVIKHHEEKKNIVVHTRPDKKVHYITSSIIRGYFRFIFLEYVIHCI